MNRHFQRPNGAHKGGEAYLSERNRTPDPEKILSGKGKKLFGNQVSFCSAVFGVTTHYYLDGRTIVWQTDGTNTIHYTYDADGQVVFMTVGGQTYYYERNGQNDVAALVDSSGNEVVQYTYDTWGKVQSVTGTLANTIGLLNPFRYRGYYYDAETGLYYLQSRYYDPGTGRFINADGIIDKAASLISGNLFAYAANNPVNNSDPDGHGIFKNIFNWIKTKVIKPAVKNVLRPVVKAIKKTYSLFGNKTYTMGVNLGIAAGFDFSCSAGITVDNKGNMGFISTYSFGGGTPSFSASLFQTFSTAKDIYCQRDHSLQIGGSASYGGISFGGEYSVFQDNTKAIYQGGTLMAGVGAPIPVEAHGELANSTVNGINVFDELENVYIKIMDW